MSLFLAQGYDATTLEQICERADISKRSFFDYFPTKEDLVFAWQDEFGVALAQAIAGRPAGEPLLEVARMAMAEVLPDFVSEPSLASAALIRTTPSLSARDGAKYVRLEATIRDALIRRRPDIEADDLETWLLAALVVASLRHGEAAFRERLVLMGAREAALRGFAEVESALRRLLGPN